MRRFQPQFSRTLAAGSLAALATLTTAAARAEGIIKHPGDHPDYGVELEPHGLLEWDNYWWGGTGFGIYHDWVSYAPPGGCPFAYGCSDSRTGAFPYFEGGGRFLFGDSVGLLVRIGYPMLTVGVSILL